MHVVTLVIAIAGFVMSVASWIKDFISQRKNIRGRILAIKSYKTVTYFELLIENRSRLPIAVTQIALSLSLGRYCCSPLPTRIQTIERRKGKEVCERITKYSTQLPIQIASLGATVASVLFEEMEELPPDCSTHLTLLIGTNRGKELQMILALPAGWETQRNIP